VSLRIVPDLDAAETAPAFAVNVNPAASAGLGLALL
jgi:hypothetical protein